MVGCEAIKAAPTAARDVHMWRYHQLLYEGITAIGPWRVVATHPTAQLRAPLVVLAGTRGGYGRVGSQARPHRA